MSVEGQADTQTFKELLQPVVSLAVTQHFSHERLAKLLREEFLEHAKSLPSIPVLYNSSYGGFDYSPAFCKFIKNEQRWTDDRSLYAELMAFGCFIKMHCMDICEPFQAEVAESMREAERQSKLERGTADMQKWRECLDKEKKLLPGVQDALVER